MTKRIINYFKNFGNIYAERRYYEIPNTWCADPMKRESFLETEAYKGVSYKNKYLYTFEFWIVHISISSPAWLIIIYYKELEPYVHYVMKKGICFILNLFFK